MVVIIVVCSNDVVGEMFLSVEVVGNILKTRWHCVCGWSGSVVVGWW